MKTSALPERRSGWAAQREILGAEFAVNVSRCLARFHPGRAFDDGIGRTPFAAWPVDLALRDWLFVLLGPAKDILAAALGTPEDFVSLCFVGAIGLVDGQRRVRGSPHSNPPGDGPGPPNGSWS